MIQTETNTNRLATIVLPNELQTKHKQQNQPKAKQQQDQQQLETKLKKQLQTKHCPIRNTEQCARLVEKRMLQAE